MPILSLTVRFARRLLDLLLVVVILLVLATVVVARIAPAVTGGQSFIVGGGSMEPTLPLGAAVLALPVEPADLRVGDMVSLRIGPQHAVFTHRIIRLVARDDGLWIATRGDANPDPDPSLVPATNVVGRVDWGVPYVGFLMALLGSVSGVTFVASLSGFLLASAWLLETLEHDDRATRRRLTPSRAARTAG